MAVATVATVKATSDETRRQSQVLQREVKYRERQAPRESAETNKECLKWLSLEPFRLTSRLLRLHEVASC